MTDAPQSVFNQTVIMFMIVIIGALCYKFGLINDEGRKQLSNLVLYVVNPLLIFLSYMTDMRAELIEGFLWTAAMAAITYIAFIFLSKLIFRDKNSRDPLIERFSVIYSNCGFMGTPLIFGVFGSDGVFIMNGFITVFNLFVWTHGVMMMSSGKAAGKGRTSLLKAVTSPAVIAVILGIIFFFTQIKLPNMIFTALNNVAEMTTPLAMIVAGASIMSAGIIKSVKNLRIYIVAAVKLIVLPIAGFALIAFLPCADTAKLITLIEFSCPAAAISTMFAIKYERNSEYASQIFAVSTLLSLITLPFIVSLGSYCLEVLHTL